MARQLLYIASPLRGNVEQNIENAMCYCAKAIADGYIPLAPHAMYQGLFDDEIPEERQAALDIGKSMLEKCSRMWVCGDRISEGMQGEIRLAKEKGIPVEEKPESFFMEQKTRTGLTFRGLQENVRRTVERQAQTSGGIIQLLRQMSQFDGYGLTNAAAIRKQNPKAQAVATYQQWKNMGYKVKDVKHSIKIWMPIVKTCFLRDGRRTDVREATAEERAGITSENIPVERYTAYRAGFVYDIAQTNCPKQEYGRVIGETNYSHLETEKMYDSLRSAAESCGFAVTENADVYKAGFHDAAITVSSRLHPAEKLAALCGAFSQGIVEQSSSQPQDIRQFEAQTLSFFLQTRLGVPDNLRDAPEPSCCHAVENIGLLESSLQRVQRMLTYAENGLREDLQEHGLDLAPAQEQTAKKEQLTEQQKQANRNFMQDIL